MAPLNPYYRSVNGVLFDKNMSTLIQYPPGRTGSYSIPEGVIRIEDVAFSTCSDLNSVSIPVSVASIGDGAFSGCAGLTSIVIPNGLTDIGEWAFSGCTWPDQYGAAADRREYRELCFLWLHESDNCDLPGRRACFGPRCIHR